jgi:hypothetical protein
VGNGGGDECGEEGRAPRPFIGSEGGAGPLDREGDRAAAGGGINAGRLIQWGGETEGSVGSEEGGRVRRCFWEWRGRRGGARAR